tara:strand:+ start:54 stop:536 length:483 start_codon:yes stop_codon:yes gene_type:complete
MFYQRIENAIDICNEHVNTLDPTNIKDKELETYLVAGLVVLIVSEYEDHLESVFVKRAEQCGDAHATNYIKKTLSQKFRSPDLGKINETLNRFDSSYKALFLGTVENSAEHAAWDSLLKARHAVVHKKGNLNLTFGELKEKYPLTKQIISNVEATLGISS